MRSIRDLTDGWKQPVFEGGDKNLSLPLTLDGKEAAQPLTLTREILIPPDEKASSFYLETRFLSGKVRVLLDGAPVREYRSLFAPRLTDLGAALTKGEPHTLTLEITPELRPDGTFTFGGASLIGTGLSHFALSDGCAPLTVRTVFTDMGVTVKMHAEIENPNNYDVLLFRLTSPDGILIDVKSARPTDANASFDLPAPMLWDGMHSAHRYSAEVMLQRDSDIIDVTGLSFGVRDLRAADNGFFTLNGLKLPLNGAFVRENDIAGLDVLASLDANLVGLENLSVDGAFLDACDRMGMLVFFVYPRTEEESDFEELSILARYFSAHPSVAFLAYRSLDPACGKKFCAAVKNNAQDIFTAGGCEILEREALSDAIPDLLFLNYSVSTEKTGFTDLQKRFEEVLAAHPDYRFAVFPKAPECIFDRHSTGAQRPDCSQEYFSMWHARVWEIFSTHKNVACYFTGYLSDKTPKSERTGLVSADLQERKDAFWFYKSRFSASDYVKLASLPASVTKKTVNVKCYTNATKLTLTVNGKEKKRRMPVRLAENVYVFENVKLKHKNNVLVLSCSAGTDTAEIFRSRSGLKKL